VVQLHGNSINLPWVFSRKRHVTPPWSREGPILLFKNAMTWRVISVLRKGDNFEKNFKKFSQGGVFLCPPFLERVLPARGRRVSVVSREFFSSEGGKKRTARTWRVTRGNLRLDRGRLAERAVREKEVAED